MVYWSTRKKIIIMEIVGQPVNSATYFASNNKLCFSVQALMTISV